MLSTRLPVGLSAWNVAGYTPASVATAAATSIALVAGAVAVGVLAVFSTRLSVGLSAWNVACYTPASVAATAIALVATAAVALVVA